MIGRGFSIGIILIIGFATVLSYAAGQQESEPFTIVKPVEGQVVRETVRVEVLRGNLPLGGFAALSIDGTGVLARAVDDDAKAIVFLWDTKEELPSLTGGPSKEGIRVGDGHHSISVAGYNSSGRKVDESSVNVVVQNAIEKDFPDGIFLGHRFRTGDTVSYDEKTVTRFKHEGLKGPQKWVLMDLGNLSSEREWSQTVADIVSPSSAVLWRKFTKGGKATGFGITSLLPENNRISYMYIDTNGWSEPTSRSRRVGETGLSDWVTLPLKKVKVGDTWRSKVRIVLDPYDIRAIEDATAESKLVGFEWESGRECAKIVTDVEWKTGGAIMGLPPNEDAQIEVSSFKGAITSYMTLATGRLIKTVENLTIDGDYLGTVGAPGERTAPGTGPSAPGQPSAPPQFYGASGGGGGGSSEGPPQLYGMAGGGGSGRPSGGPELGGGGSGLPPLGPGSATPPTGGGLQTRRQPGRSGTPESAERTDVTVVRKVITSLKLD